MGQSLNKDEIYERWGKEFEATKNLPFVPAEKYRNLIVVLQTCEILTSKVKVGRNKKIDQLQLISRFIMAHVYQLGAGAYQLTRSGFGSPALILGRSILESLIDMTYLWLCKEISGDDVERNAWVDYYKVTRCSIYTHWEGYKNRRQTHGKTFEEFFENKTVDRLKEDYNNYKADYPHVGNKVFWAKESSLLKRAQLIDNTGKLQRGFPDKNIEGFLFSFEEEYIAIYKHTSEYVHGESGSLQALLDRVGTIIIGPSNINVITANGLVANYLLVFAYIFAHINNLDLHMIPKELERHGFIFPSQEN